VVVYFVVNLHNKEESWTGVKNKRKKTGTSKCTTDSSLFGWPMYSLRKWKHETQAVLWDSVVVGDSQSNHFAYVSAAFKQSRPSGDLPRWSRSRPAVVKRDVLMASYHPQPNRIFEGWAIMSQYSPTCVLSDARLRLGHGGRITAHKHLKERGMFQIRQKRWVLHMPERYKGKTWIV